MGAKIASFLATLVLSVPLAAIGLMAVFGIPQLVPAVAGPDKPSLVRNVQNALAWKSQDSEAPPAVSTDLGDAPSYGTSHTAAAWPVGNDADRLNRDVPSATPERGRMTDPFSPAARQPATAAAQSPRHWSDLSSMAEQAPRSAANAPVQVASLEQPRAPFASSAVKPAAFTQQQNPALSGPTLNWREASLRLHDLGIRDYHLERGASESSFLFVCVFSPGDAPQVVHRFEAEAEDPLVAVNQVLNQVDGWMRGRFAASNFPARPQNLSLTSGTSLR
jgi:hypothetical protein